MEHRQKVKALIKDKLVDKLLNDNFNIDDLERGIYNWTIDYATKRHLIKNWKNSMFTKIYLEKARSVISNLDPNSYIKNTRFIERLKEKEFLPHEVCFMKSENIFPERWQNTITQYLKKFEYAYEDKKQATTDQFKCSKCKKRECTYYCMLTRSGDEPETIFIRCVNCGHQFRQ